jgi:hypothetical protein
MPGGRGNIKPSDNTNGFQKNKQNINSTGLNRKSYAHHIKSIKDKGYQPPLKSEYYEMIGLLLSMTEDDLKKFAQDKKRPYWIRLIVIDLNTKSTRQKMMSDHRDWLFGKAHTTADITSGGEKISTIIKWGDSEIEI